MSIYEHTYIATPDCNRKDIDNIEKKIESILTSNAGKIVRKEDWGLRNLAYPIKKNVKGIYQNLYFDHFCEMKYFYSLLIYCLSSHKIGHYQYFDMDNYYTLDV